MATKEELEEQNAALKEELEEARREAAMEQNVWNSSLPSPKENRERVKKRLGYEQAAVSALTGAQPDSSVAVAVAESSVDADLAEELERLRKENEELKASQVEKEEETAKDGVAKKDDDKPAAKKTASKQSFK